MSTRDIFGSVLAEKTTQVFAVVTRNLTTDNERLKEVIKNLIEVRPLSFNGLTSGWSLDEKCELVAAEVNPEITWNEVYGGAVENALYEWFTEQMKTTMEPSEYSDSRTRFEGIDVMFIQPCSLYKNVVKAWHCKNMHFVELKGKSGQRNINHRPHSPTELTVRFNVSKTEQKEALEEASKILKEINVSAANPYLREAFVQDESNLPQNGKNVVLHYPENPVTEKTSAIGNIVGELFISDKITITSPVNDIVQVHLYPEVNKQDFESILSAWVLDLKVPEMNTPVAGVIDHDFTLSIFRNGDFYSGLFPMSTRANEHGSYDFMFNKMVSGSIDVSFEGAPNPNPEDPKTNGLRVVK